MSEFRIRLRRGDLEIEVAGADKDYVEARVDRYLGLLGGRFEAPPPSPESAPGLGLRPLSTGDFIKQIGPSKKTEIAATLAYFLEYYSEPPHEEWRPDDVASKFTDVRKAKPANITDLLNKSSYFMAGREKGYYRLSEAGVQWVEEARAKHAS